ncbi:hypothetical protein GCM10007079_13450 [Nocardiopsis terrae]|nr:hypothetical protein GCM10007079_13450 [Nocardiopsis terrae]
MTRAESSDVRCHYPITKSSELGAGRPGHARTRTPRAVGIGPSPPQRHFAPVRPFDRPGRRPQPDRGPGRPYRSTTRPFAARSSSTRDHSSAPSTPSDACHRWSS